MAWIIGWNLVLEYLAAGSTVAVGWSGYFTDFMAKQSHMPMPRLFDRARSVRAMRRLHRTTLRMIDRRLFQSAGRSCWSHS